MSETITRIILARILPGVLAAFGGYIYANYVTLHSAFCAVN